MMSRYARSTAIRQAVQAARASGFPISSVDLRPDGTIRLSAERSDRPEDSSEFDRWEAAGKL